MDWRDGLLMLLGQQAAGLVQSNELLNELNKKIDELREEVDRLGVDTEEETE